VTEAAGHSPTGATISSAGVTLGRFLVWQGLGQAADAVASVALAGIIVVEVERAVTPGGVVRALVTTAVPLVVAAPLAAWVADRVDRRRGLAGAGVGRALLTVAAVAVPIVGGQALSYATLAALLLATRVAYTVRAAAMPCVVPLPALAGADARSLVVGKVAGVLGAAAGAILSVISPLAGLSAAAGVHLATVIGWVTFPCHLGGGSHRSSQPVNSAPAGRTEILTSSHRALLGVAFTTFVLLADGRSNMTAVGYASAGAAIGVGSFLGALTASRARAVMSGDRVAPATYGIAGLAMAGAAVAPRFVTVAAAVAAASYCFQTLRVVADATIQAAAPDIARGRAFSRYDVLHNLGFVAGGLAGVVLHELLSPATVFAVVGTGYATGAIATISRRGTTRRCAPHPLSVVGVDDFDERAHHVDRERRRLVNEEQEGVAVDRGDLRQLGGDRGQAPRTPGDDRHLAKGAVGADGGDDLVAATQLDLAADHAEHLVAGVALVEDRRSRGDLPLVLGVGEDTPQGHGATAFHGGVALVDDFTLSWAGVHSSATRSGTTSRAAGISS
jgi:hypothetical protein